MRRLSIAVVALLLAARAVAGPYSWGTNSAVNPSGASSKTITAPNFLPTAGDLAIYVSPTGSDLAAGTEGAPLQTLQTALAKLPPRWAGKARILLAAGAYSVSGPYAARFGGPLAGTPGTVQPLVIQGVMSDSGLGSRTISSVGSTSATTWSDVGHVYQVKDSTLSIAANAYDGHFLRITSGSASGMRRLIRGNTTDGQFELTVGDVGSHPAPGDTFVIETPASVVTFTDTFYLQALSPGFDRTNLILSQLNLTASGSGATLLVDSGTNLVANTVRVNLGTTGALKVNPGARLSAGRYVGGIADDVIHVIGWYGSGMSTIRGSYLLNAVQVVGGSVDGNFVTRNSGVMLDGGSAQYPLSNAYLDGYDSYGGYVYVQQGSSVSISGSYYGPAARILNSPTYGLKLSAANGTYVQYLDISNCTGDAIMVDTGSSLQLDGVTGGTNGSGIRLSGAGNAVTSTSTVTVTGTSGDVVAGSLSTTHAAVSAGSSFFHPILGVVSVTGGLPNSWLKHQRFPITITTPGFSSVTLTWTASFSDTAYTAVCSLYEGSAAGNSLGFPRITTKAAGSLTALIYNYTSNTLSGTIDCTAVHDL